MRKRRRERRQAGIRKASESEPPMKHRKREDDIRTGACVEFRDESGGCPVYWPGGVRCEGGASLICGFCMELGKAGVDSAASCLKGCGAARGSAPGSRNC